MHPSNEQSDRLENLELHFIYFVLATNSKTNFIFLKIKIEFNKVRFLTQEMVLPYHLKSEGAQGLWAEDEKKHRIE